MSWITPVSFGAATVFTIATAVVVVTVPTSDAPSDTASAYAAAVFLDPALAVPSGPASAGAAADGAPDAEEIASAERVLGALGWSSLRYAMSPDMPLLRAAPAAGAAPGFVDDFMSGTEAGNGGSPASPALVRRSSPQAPGQAVAAAARSGGGGAPAARAAAPAAGGSNSGAGQGGSNAGAGQGGSDPDAAQGGSAPILITLKAPLSPQGLADPFAPQGLSAPSPTQGVTAVPLPATLPMAAAALLALGLLRRRRPA